MIAGSGECSNKNLQTSQGSNCSFRRFMTMRFIGKALAVHAPVFWRGGAGGGPGGVGCGGGVGCRDGAGTGDVLSPTEPIE